MSRVARHPPASGGAGERRIRELVDQLSLEEKIGQITSVPLPPIGVGIDPAILAHPPGLVLVPGSVPLAEAIVRIRALQDGLLENRPGIPAIPVAMARPDGLGSPGPLATAATWDVDMVERIAGSQAAGLRAAGLLATFGAGSASRSDPAPAGDPMLAGAVAAAQVWGAQGRAADRSDPLGQRNVVVVVGLGVAEDASWHERTLRSRVLRASEAAVAAGALMVVPSEAGNAGVPGHADSWLLKDVLREEWQFSGIVVSAPGAIHGLVNRHRVATDIDDAIATLIESGVDVLSGGADTASRIAGLVRRGVVPRWLIEDSALAVVTLKHRLGLLDGIGRDPRRSAPAQNDARASPDPLHRSAVLVGDPASALPLPATGVVSVVDAPAGSTPGPAVRELADTLAAALPAATVRAGPPSPADDPRDTTVVLLTADPAAAAAPAGRIVAAGQRCVVLVCTDVLDDLGTLATTTATILLCWDRPERVAAGVAGILAGVTEPVGRLPVGVPIGFPVGGPAGVPAGAAAGHAGRRAGYPLGHGFGYTTFRYSRLHLDPAELVSEETVRVRFSVANTGNRAGREVAQVYLNRRTGAVADPRPLVGFAALDLAAGQRQTVIVEVPLAQLAMWDQGMRHVLPPGTVEVLVGRSATDIQLSATLTIGATQAVEPNRLR